LGGGKKKADHLIEEGRTNHHAKEAKKRVSSISPKGKERNLNLRRITRNVCPVSGEGGKEGFFLENLA